MRILVINPNSTDSMTASIGEAAQAAAADGTQIIAVNPPHGPAAIEGPADGDAALPGLFALFEQEVAKNGTYHAVIIACFDDTGLMELRCRSPIPVTGIGEAGYRAAADKGERFTVVTTLPISVPILEANIEAYGLSHQCAKVRASGIGVLALENEASAIPQLEAEIAAAIREDGCHAIVLGCAGMAAFASSMEAAHGIPVVDGVAAAVSWCERHAVVRVA